MQENIKNVKRAGKLEVTRKYEVEFEVVRADKGWTEDVLGLRSVELIQIMESFASAATSMADVGDLSGTLAYVVYAGPETNTPFWVEAGEADNAVDAETDEPIYTHLGYELSYSCNETESEITKVRK